MTMELDTGTAMSIISEETFQRIAGKGVTLKPSNTRLTSYTGDTVYGAGDGKGGRASPRMCSAKDLIHPANDCDKRKRSIAAWLKLV